MMAPCLKFVKLNKDGIFSFGVILFLEICLLTLNCVNASSEAVIPNEALSSPSSIIALKHSAVWLHWKFSLAGPSNVITFGKQHWIVNDTYMNNISIIADKKGPSGSMAVSSNLPSSVAGRIIAFPNNDTLSIQDLQYGDNLRKFQSDVSVDVSGTPLPRRFPLVPEVTLTVEGAPEFLSSPSTNLEVSENNVMSVITRLDGNPKPSAAVQWSDASATIPLILNEEQPFVYRAEYSVNRIASSFCGKTLTLTAQNSFGKPADITIAVTVLLSLSDPNLRAGKPNQSCVEVQWQKKESGLCNVNYTVKFKDQSGTVKYTNTEINKSGTTRCGIPSNVNVTQVELQMSSTKRSETFTASVSEKPIPPPTSAPTTKAPRPPTTPGTQVGAIVGGAVGGLVALVLLVLLVVYCMKRGKRDRDRDNDSGEPGYPLANKKENVYASADEPHTKAPEPTYADPNKPTLIYGKLGEGGGRKGPRPPRNEPSEYADVMLDENGYPAVGAVTSYTDGYGDKPRSREGSGRRAGPENRRPPPPYTEPKLDEDGYPTGGRVPPVYAQVDKSRRKR